MEAKWFLGGQAVLLFGWKTIKHLATHNNYKNDERERRYIYIYIYREREREREWGLGHLGKTQKSGKNSQPRVTYFHNLDQTTTSFLFKNFSDEVRTAELWKTFSWFGRVGEVFIPKKLNRWGRRFGFAKFIDVENVE